MKWRGSDVPERYTPGCFVVIWSAPNDSVTQNFTDPGQRSPRCLSALLSRASGSLTLKTHSVPGKTTLERILRSRPACYCEGCLDNFRQRFANPDRTGSSYFAATLSQTRPCGPYGSVLNQPFARVHRARLRLCRSSRSLATFPSAKTAWHQIRHELAGPSCLSQKFAKGAHAVRSRVYHYFEDRLVVLSPSIGDAPYDAEVQLQDGTWNKTIWVVFD